MNPRTPGSQPGALTTQPPTQWMRRDSNPRLAPCKRVTLPLSYASKAVLTGLEPATFRLTTGCATTAPQNQGGVGRNRTDCRQSCKDHPHCLCHPHWPGFVRTGLPFTDIHRETPGVSRWLGRTRTYFVHVILDRNVRHSIPSSHFTQTYFASQVLSGSLLKLSHFCIPRKTLFSRHFQHFIDSGCPPREHKWEYFLHYSNGVPRVGVPKPHIFVVAFLPLQRNDLSSENTSQFFQDIQVCHSTTNPGGTGLTKEE